MSMRLLVNSMPMLKRKPFEATQAPLQKFSFQHRFLRRLVCPWLHLQWQNLYKLFEDFGTSRPEFHFSVQRYCGLEERQVPLSLSIGGFAGSLPQIFPSLQNLGIPSALSDLTLALSSILSAVAILHEKRFSRPRSSKGFNKREKNQINK